MNGSLQGKRALVTGATKGIGLAVAQALVLEGAAVAICARKDNELRRAVEVLSQRGTGSKVVGCVADVADAKRVGDLFAFVDRELGGVDILINNAGLGIFRPAAELSVEEWDALIGVNLSGAFYCSREALARFQRAGGGFIINISSLAGRNPFAGGSGYNASKFGMNGFSEAMMLDHRNDNVKVSYIMPGSVDTDFSGKAGEKQSDWKIAPEDVAQLVLHILHMPARTLISRVEVRPSRPKKNS